MDVFLASSSEREAYPDLPKNDWVDAFVIADHLRFGRIAREVYMDDYRYKALQTLTRARFEVIQNLTFRYRASDGFFADSNFCTRRLRCFRCRV